MMSMIHLSRRIKNIYLSAVLVMLSVCALLPPEPAFAVTVPEGDVALAVNNWLSDEAGSFGENLGHSVKEVRLYKGGASGNIGYYLVILEPNGWVILPADDEFWPIQSFGRGAMTPDAFEKTLWHDITSFSKEDLPSSLKSALSSGGTPAKISKETKKSQAKWRSLTTRKTPSSEKTGIQGLHNEGWPQGARLIVHPFLDGKPEAIWGQSFPFDEKTTYLNLLKGASSDYGSVAAFENINGRYARFPVGCTALSTGQLMSYLMTKYGLTSSDIHGDGEVLRNENNNN